MDIHPAIRRVVMARRPLYFAFAFLLSGNVDAQFVDVTVGGALFSRNTIAGTALGAPVFGPNNELLSAGSGYPTVGAILPSNVITVGGGITAPTMPLPTSSSGISPFRGLFGSGSSSFFGFFDPNAHTFAGGAGEFWPTAIASGRASPGTVDVAESRGIATFRSQADMDASVGAFFAARSFLMNEPGTLVAGAVRGTVTIDGQATSPFSVVFATDGPGTLPDFVSSTGPSGVFGAASLTPTGFGISALPGSVRAGSLVEIDATVTLMKTLGGVIQDGALPAQFTSATPDLVAGVGRTAQIVPEPGMLPLFACGLLMLIALASRWSFQARLS